MSANVLIVDDSASVRQQVNAVLTQAGLNVLEACDGVEGKIVIDGGTVDCVICDINMPRKDGIQMVQEVKQDSRFKDLPVVMLTTEGAKELVEKAKAAGACGWIVKPFKADMLVSAVKRLSGVSTA